MSKTVIFILALVVVIALFDIYIIWKSGKHESISAYIIRGSKRYPLLVLIAGVVLGHLFWSFRTEGLYENVKCFRYVDGQAILLEN